MSAMLKCALAALLFTVACLFAAPGQAAQVDMTDVIFKEVEKRLIREYFASQGNVRDDGRDSREHYRKGKGYGSKAYGGKGHGGKGQGKYGKNKKSKHAKRDKRGLPPGLAKRQGLPPGLAKRERLPPGLAKRDLPPGLNRVLPTAAAGTERVIIDNNVVLIQKATGIVLDILLDAVEGTQ